MANELDGAATLLHPMSSALSRLLTPANVIAAAVTFIAAAAVAVWSLLPVHRALDYRLGTAVAGASLSPRHVPVGFEGFSGAEPWGRWTDEPQAAIVFGRPLPQRFALSLTGHAFGPNVGAPVEVCAADACRPVVFGGVDGTVTTTFVTHHAARRVVLHVPHPTTPNPMDHRLLGIGLVDVHVAVDK